MARLVVATMGSWGDLFPAIGLTKEAAVRGHTVTIAATPAYAELLEAEQLSVASVGPRFGPEEFAADPAIRDGRMGGFAGFLHLFRSVVFPNLSEWVEELRGTLAGADLLITHPTLVAAPIAAELAGVPWSTFSVFPGLIPAPTPSRAPAGRHCRRAAQAGRSGGLRGGSHAGTSAASSTSQ